MFNNYQDEAKMGTIFKTNLNISFKYKGKDPWVQIFQ
jgi:hypothetical protein